MKKENHFFSQSDFSNAHVEGLKSADEISEETTVFSFKIRKQIIKNFKNTLLHNIEYTSNKKTM